MTALDSIADPHAAHFAARQADLLRRFRAIQQRLVDGYEATARAARIDMQSDDPLIAHYASVRYAWATQAANDARARMEAVQP